MLIWYVLRWHTTVYLLWRALRLSLDLLKRRGIFRKQLTAIHLVGILCSFRGRYRHKNTINRLRLLMATIIIVIINLFMSHRITSRCLVIYIWVWSLCSFRLFRRRQQYRTTFHRWQLLVVAATPVIFSPLNRCRIASRRFIIGRWVQTLHWFRDRYRYKMMVDRLQLLAAIIFPVIINLFLGHSVTERSLYIHNWVRSLCSLYVLGRR
mmetsp:Transcript_12916/g.18815  ORF Transcript_12916/g.18815 Transcript_12916/m.18815 type:complete len:209 (+) Transcript_12916:277-903(+)